MDTINQPSTFLVDSHCHLHCIDDLGTLLDNASTSFQQAAAHHNIASGWYGVLAFTDTAKSTSFSHIRFMITSSTDNTLEINGWTLEVTDENCSVKAVNAQDITIFICAGQQIVTAERIELLSLFKATRIADAYPIKDCINQVNEHGGLAVLPWGVGKWLGKRGTIVSQMMQTCRPGTLFLGDNSARPKSWARVGQFVEAEKLGIPILRGTDPLNINNKTKWGGDFGFIVEGDFIANRPAETLRMLLKDSSTVIRDYGELNSTKNFLVDQFALRFKSKS